MTGFEHGFAGFVSDHAVNCATPTTSAHSYSKLGRKYSVAYFQSERRRRRRRRLAKISNLDAKSRKNKNFFCAGDVSRLEKYF